MWAHHKLRCTRAAVAETSKVAALLASATAAERHNSLHSDALRRPPCRSERGPWQSVTLFVRLNQPRHCAVGQLSSHGTAPLASFQPRHCAVGQHSSRGIARSPIYLIDHNFPHPPKPSTYMRTCTCTCTSSRCKLYSHIPDLARAYLFDSNTPLVT